MLKLSRLYSDDEAIFPCIKFRDGVNVVFANVTAHEKNKSSHSLGKTTLVELINFMLLKKIDKNSFLKKEVFKEFVFYLEIECEDSRYVTVRRPVKGKISIHVSGNSSKLDYLDKKDWKHGSLGVDKAKDILDSDLALKVVTENGFHYRNGLRYCLRKQTRYEETFKVNSSSETDVQWKPYLSGILGLDPEIVTAKYDANNKVKSLKNAIDQIKALPQESTQSLEAEIAQIEASVLRMNTELDEFDFRKADIDVNGELVEEVSQCVSNYNKQIYEIDQRVVAINGSLETEFSFDINKVYELFSEVEIFFPENLSRSYEDLIELNKQMSSGRKLRMKTAKKKLIEGRKITEVNLFESMRKQKELASILIEKDSFSKYKILQNRLLKEQNRLAVLNERVEKLDTVSTLSGRYKKAVDEQEEAKIALDKATRIRGNAKMKKAVELFSEMVEDVLGISAFFFMKNNNAGNIEFEIGLKDQTSVADGFSYTRVLSAIFDFTLLLIYADESFYKFCYHDGLFESLDDRVKIKLIDKMREISEKYGLQFIISVLDSDIPIGDSGSKEYFQKDEIIRELHDQGDDGRLFRMPAF